ncbi:DoxX family membrane protein [Flavobacterium sedimenticola]|uniref:DoxX family protein n=1 Tax=Flavobacterium sedimenticola TaxID=3043286 RepID=A0ABT6XP86_9FLAO|nr:DoxX family membrane protein [Flavobacterium sedimenticola]MDI9256903.1 DoxX family protein [Flavobacterium sedimenticola]
MKSKIIFVVSLLFGLLFINAGLDKFLHHMPVPNDIPEPLMKAFGAFMEINWLLPLVGAAELVGGVLFIIPKTRALGAVVLFPVMVGILLTNTITDTSGMPIALVLLAIHLWVIYENRAKYAHLIG